MGAVKHCGIGVFMPLKGHLHHCPHTQVVSEPVHTGETQQSRQSSGSSPALSVGNWASALTFLARGTGQHVKVSAALGLLILSGETSVKFFFCSNFLTFLGSCDNPPVTHLISQKGQPFVF